MGLIKFGGGVTAISGKIGGTVYARNRGGAYARNWAKPTNTPTEKQSLQRLGFGNVSKDWSALSKALQTDWDSLASTMTRINRLGDAYTPTGRQVYLESSNNLRQIGLSPLTTPPITSLQPTIDGTPVLVLEEAASVIDSITINGLAAQSGISYVVEATKPFADLKTNFTNDYRQVATGNTATAISFIASYIAAYGDSMPLGAQVAVRLKYVDSQTGWASPMVVLTAIAEAA